MPLVAVEGTPQVQVLGAGFDMLQMNRLPWKQKKN